MNEEVRLRWGWGIDSKSEGFYIFVFFSEMSRFLFFVVKFIVLEVFKEFFVIWKFV